VRACVCVCVCVSVFECVYLSVWMWERGRIFVCSFVCMYGYTGIAGGIGCG
jgi:hypothetical protein